MIINIRGANGSGKSTIVRKVMSHYTTMPVYRDGRKRPIGYVGVNHINRLYVVGHYETDCGGCDTITQLDDVYKEIREAAENGLNVLYEGIMVSGEYRRCVSLKETGFDVRVFGLDVDINTCIAGVLKRRQARGETKAFTPDRTVRRMKEVERMMEHLRVCKVPVLWGSREQVLWQVLELLGVNV